MNGFVRSSKRGFQASLDASGARRSCQIISYIARDNPAAALRVGERILGSVEPLKNMPQLGRKVPERQDETIREIIRGNYRIIYPVRQDQQAIEIWRIWHGAR